MYVCVKTNNKLIFDYCLKATLNKDKYFHIISYYITSKIVGHKKMITGRHQTGKNINEIQKLYQIK